VLKQLTGVAVGIQALEAAGTVTADDYEQVFAPLVDQARQTASRMRLLYQFGPDFQRITPGALWADTRLGTSYVRVLDGCAVVSDIDWIRPHQPAASARGCRARSGFLTTTNAMTPSHG
jgi:hypothetical protein